MAKFAFPSLFVLLAALVFPPPAAAETINYVLQPLPDQNRCRVELTWETSGRTLSMLGVSPKWGTITDVAGLLKNVRIEGGSSVRRQGSRWIVEHRRGATLRCQYEVDPGQAEYDWDHYFHPITTDTFFHGIGNTFLLVPEGGNSDMPVDYDVALRWNLPSGWKAVCSWGVGSHVGAHIRSTDLRHSIYLAGPLIQQTRKEGGHEVTVAMLDSFGFNLDLFARLASGVIAEQCDFMGDKNFPAFVVTAIPIGEPMKDGQTRLAGTGLYQSFALFLAPKAVFGDTVEHLFAHELFHYWNGRLLSAKAPEELVYWFTEGFTDYYSLRILYESRRWKPDVYLKWINQHVQKYYANPAIHAKNEDVRTGFWSQRETVGEMAYQRGLLLALRWHRLARDRGITDGVDKLFLALVNRARAGKGNFELTNEIIRKTGCETLGTWFGEEFDRYVTRAETIDLPENTLAPDFIAKVKATYDYKLGFERDRSLNAKRVRGLEPGSEAEKAGLREDDQLLGWTIPGESDKKVELKIRRGDKTETISFYPRGKRHDATQFQPAERRTGKP